MGLSRERKTEYFEKMKALMDKYSKVFLVSCDNVTSKQFQQIRAALRGDAVILMGKNTMMRRIIANYVEEKGGQHPVQALVAHCRGNTGFVFTDGDLAEVRDKLLANVIPAPARVGAVAPCDVVIPPGPTDCDPGQTAFFQTLQIATKIAKGRIEITSPVELIKKGEKVNESQATLCHKLAIEPFSYGLVVQNIYDNGSIFPPAVLDITPAALSCKFATACRNLAAFCMGMNMPNAVTIPHSIAAAFKSVVSVAVECENFSFEKADPFKAYLKDPSAFAGSGGGGGGGGGGGDDGGAAAAAAKKEEEEEEEVDMGGGMDMFGDGGGGDDY